MLVRPLQRPRDGFRHVLHVGRLQPRAAAAEQRIDRQPAGEVEDGGEKRVVRSEHHRGADERRARERGTDRDLALAALADIARGRAGVGADARDVREPLDPGAGCLRSDPADGPDM
jgi:hypothetical protein